MYRTWTSDTNDKRNDKTRVSVYNGKRVRLANGKVYRVLDVRVKTSKKLEIFKLGKELKTK